MPNSEKIIEDLEEAAAAAKIHFEIYWSYVSDSEESRLAVVSDHSDFFRASRDAHYTAAFVYLARIFDSRSDSSSVRRYIELNRDSVEGDVIKDLESDFASLKRRAGRLLRVRHKCVAHADSQMTEKEIFSEVDMTWNAIRQVFEESAEFVKSLALKTRQPNPGVPTTNRWFDATRALVESIRRQ